MDYIKTYGIYGLLEWHGVLKSGSVKMKVDFTNGSLTAYGVAPATFCTANKLTQHIIENSDMFKSGRIKVYQLVEIPGSEEPKADDVPAADAAGAVVDNPAGEASGTEAAPDGEASGTAAGGVQVVKVADKAEAVEWLKSQYPEKGYTSVKLRGKEAFENACKECNVKFEF